MTDKPVQIEQTSKRWKKIQLAGACIIGLAVLIAVLGGVLDTQGVRWEPVARKVIYSAAVPGAIGVCVSIYGSCMAWWHHG